MTFILKKKIIWDILLYGRKIISHVSLRIEVNYLFLGLIKGSKYQDCLVTETKINVTNLNYAFL